MARARLLPVNTLSLVSGPPGGDWYLHNCFSIRVNGNPVPSLLGGEGGRRPDKGPIQGNAETVRTASRFDHANYPCQHNWSAARACRGVVSKTQPNHVPLTPGPSPRRGKGRMRMSRSVSNVVSIRMPGWQSELWRFGLWRDLGDRRRSHANFPVMRYFQGIHELFPAHCGFHHDGQERLWY